jgi:hypothetical protein
MKRVLAGGLAVALVAALGCGGASSTAPKGSLEDTQKKYEAGAAGAAMQAKYKSESGGGMATNPTTK